MLAAQAGSNKSFLTWSSSDAMTSTGVAYGKNFPGVIMKSCFFLKGLVPSTGSRRICILTLPQVLLRYYVTTWPPAECPISINLLSISAITPGTLVFNAAWRFESIQLIAASRACVTFYGFGLYSFET